MDTSVEDLAVSTNAANEGSDTGRGYDGNQQFFDDLRGSLSPFVNSSGVLEILPALISLVCALSVAANTCDEPSLKSLLLGASQKGSKTIASAFGSMSGAGTLSGRSSSLLLRGATGFQDGSAGSLDSRGKMETPVQETRSALIQFEILEHHIDEWLYLLAQSGLLFDSNITSGYSEELAALSKSATSFLGDQMEISKLVKASQMASDELWKALARNATRFDITVHANLPALTATKLLMMGSTIKSGWAPISTVIPKLSDPQASLVGEGSSNVTVVQSSHSDNFRLQSSQTNPWKFHDPGYLSAPFLNVTLTFFLSHLTHGPDDGVDWSGLQDVGELKGILEKLQSEASFAASPVSDDVRAGFQETCEVLQDISSYLKKTSDPKVADVGVSKVDEWRSRLFKVSRPTAAHATALATIPGTSLNTPEPPGKGGMPTLPPNPISDHSFATLNLYRIHTDYEAVSNSLQNHECASQRRQHERSYANSIRTHFNEFSQVDNSSASVANLLVNGIHAVAFLKREIVDLRRYLTAMYVLVESLICGENLEDSAPGSTPRDRSGPFMGEIIFVCAHMVGSSMKLISDMLKPFETLQYSKLTSSTLMALLHMSGEAPQTEPSDQAQSAVDKLRKSNDDVQRLVSDCVDTMMEPFPAALRARLGELKDMLDNLEQQGISLDPDALAAIREGAKDARDASLLRLNSQPIPEFYPTLGDRVRIETLSLDGKAGSQTPEESKFGLSEGQ